MPNAALNLRQNRRATRIFIASDPTELILTPMVSVDRPAGAKKKSAGTPRDPQIFKVIYPGGDGILVTADGKTRRFDFIIVGEYDASVAIGDFWDEGNQHYVIEYLFPINDYEVKAGGVTHGSSPDHG